MTFRRRFLPAATFAAVLIARSASAQPSVDGFWALDRELPRHPRTEVYTVKTGDPDATAAAIEVWMDEQHAAPTRPNAVADRSRRSWVVPVSARQELERMLREYGKVARRRSQLDTPPGAFGSDRKSLIDPRAVITRRDALQKELDSLGDRAQFLPNVAMLGAAFVTTLDRIAEARERYDAVFVADIDLNGTQPVQEGDVVPGLNGPMLVGASANIPQVQLLPISYGVEPGAPRVPQFGDRQGDYLAWTPVTATIDEIASLKIDVLTSEPEAAFERINTALRKIQADSTPLQASPSSGGRHKALVHDILYPALPLTGYLIPKESIEKVRSIASANGNVVGWQPRTPAWRESFRQVPPWRDALVSEIKASPGRLAGLPFLRALAVDQIRRLAPFADVLGPAPTSEFVALEIVTKPESNMVPAPLPQSSGASSAMPLRNPPTGETPPLTNTGYPSLPSASSNP